MLPPSKLPNKEILIKDCSIKSILMVHIAKASLNLSDTLPYLYMQFKSDETVSYYPRQPFYKIVLLDTAMSTCLYNVYDCFPARTAELSFKTDNHSRSSFILFCSPSIFNYI